MGRENKQEEGREGDAQGQLCRQLSVTRTQSRTYRMKEKVKCPRQNIDEGKQVKLSYKS